jgi:hypothetical protein
MNFNQTQKLYWQVGKDNFILKIQDFKKLFILQLLTQISNAELIKKCPLFTVHPRAHNTVVSLKSSMATKSILDLHLVVASVCLSRRT